MSSAPTKRLAANKPEFADSQAAAARAPSSPLGEGKPPASARPIARSGLFVYLALAALGAAADLLTKEWVFHWRGLPRPNHEWWLIEGFCGIETSVNRGALFGMGQGYSSLFAVFSLVALCGIAVWIIWGRATTNGFLSFALGCITAGILGNLYDRLGLWDATGLPPDYHHGVRDWILFRFGAYTWPNFNLADSLLVCGALVLAWRSWVDGDPPAKSAG